MNRTARHPLVEEYLRDLERAARRMPRREREDLLAEIAGHIDAGMEEAGGSDAAVRNLLAGLGEPETIVASAGGAPTPTRGPGVLEVAAVLFLLIGGIIIPIFGWFIGLVLLWASSAWTSAMKALGTLVFPGGLAAPLLLGLMASPAVLPHWVGLPLLLALVAGPVVVAAILLRSAERPATSG